MFELIRSNKRRSVALIVGFMVVVALVGAAIGLVVGNGILREPGIGLQWWTELADPPNGWAVSLEFYWTRLFAIAAPLLLGGLILGLATATPAYFVTNYVIRTYRLRRWGQLTPPKDAVAGNGN